MNALIDNYRHFVESKVPRGVKLVGWFTLGFVQLYTIRNMALRGAQKEVKKIRAQPEIVKPPKK